MKSIKRWVHNSPKVIIISLNALLLFVGFLIILGALIKDGSLIKVTALIPIVLLLSLSTAGFFIKNGLGWLLTALPGFLIGVWYVFYIEPYSHFELKHTLIFLLFFNLIVFLFNTKAYQEHFKIGGRKLILLNCLNALLSFFMIEGHASYLQYFN